MDSRFEDLRRVGYGRGNGYREAYYRYKSAGDSHDICVMSRIIMRGIQGFDERYWRYALETNPSVD